MAGSDGMPAKHFASGAGAGPLTVFVRKRHVIGAMQRKVQRELLGASRCLQKLCGERKDARLASHVHGFVHMGLLQAELFELLVTESMVVNYHTHKA